VLAESGLDRARAAAPRLASGAWIAAVALLFLKSSALFRHPDGALPGFARWPLMTEARWIEGALAPAAALAAEGDTFVFEGFRPMDRVSWRFQMSAPRRIETANPFAPSTTPPPGAWIVSLEKRDGLDCLEVRPPLRPAWTNCREAP
jgi:hypothetical protein